MKFLSFLQSLKTDRNIDLIESISRGFIACFEVRAAKPKKISEQEAIDRKMFGPVWHGTEQERREQIEKEGFRVFIGGERSGEVRHGYETSNYHNDIPAPIHHLGYGIYLTTSKTIAKSFNNGSLKGLKTYYLDVPRIETINFGAPRTMMKWWMENGYDYPKTKDRVKSTKNLTKDLKSKYDAVWFKGKGLRRLLDGDQVVVFDPKNIHEVDTSLAKPWEKGSKVRRKADGMPGVIVSKRDMPVDYLIENIENRLKELSPDEDASELQQILGNYKHMKEIAQPYYFEVKWSKGGKEFNVMFDDMELR